MTDPNVNNSPEKNNESLPQLFVQRSLATEEDILKWRQQLENFLKILHKKPKVTRSDKVKVPYVAIDVVEKELDKLFFGQWKWEILFPPQQFLNEICITGRLHYFHPVSLQWLFRDGVGVAMIRTKEKTDFTDLRNKIQNTLQMDIPHAEAEALKSASAKIGDKFGRNLRRDVKEDYYGFYPNDVSAKAKPGTVSETLNSLKVELFLITTLKDFEAKSQELLRKANELSLAEETDFKREFQNHYNKLKGRK